MVSLNFNYWQDYSCLLLLLFIFFYIGGVYENLNSGYLLDEIVARLSFSNMAKVVIITRAFVSQPLKLLLQWKASFYNILRLGQLQNRTIFLQNTRICHRRSTLKAVILKQVLDLVRWFPFYMHESPNGRQLTSHLLALPSHISPLLG